MGRPSKLETIDIEKVKKLCLAGCTNEQMAIALDVCPATIYNFLKTDEDFLETVNKNKGLADALVQKSLWERATGYTHPEEQLFHYQGQVIRVETRKHYPPDTAAAFIWLKNRKPEEWKDKHEIEHKGSKELIEALHAQAEEYSKDSFVSQRRSLSVN